MVHRTVQALVRYQGVMPLAMSGIVAVQPVPALVSTALKDPLA